MCRNDYLFSITLVMNRLSASNKKPVQHPTASGLLLDSEVTLHDPIKFGSEDAEGHSDFLCEQCAKANRKILPSLSLPGN